MELRHLRYFVVLAEELHFGNAARRLNITQPPLSVNIRQLEESLGARLFERDSRSVRLTPVGAAFLPEAIRVLAQAQAAEDAGRALGAGKAGKVHIAFTSSMLYRGMPEILQAFDVRHPEIELELHDMTVLEQNDALPRRMIDAGFSPRQNVAPGLASHALDDDSFVCCVHESHWVAGRGSIALQALAGEKFVVFAREITPKRYDLLLSMCLRAGFRPREAAHVRQWLTAVVLASFGVGVALVPASLQRAHVQRVRFIPLDGEQMQTPGYFTWNPEAMSPALERFIAEVERHLERQRAGVA